MTLTNEDIAVDLDKCSENMDLQSLFRRSGPLHIEVGSGKGTFLLNQAKLYPHVNYLGIEWANKYYRYSVDRMRRWDISNVRILRTDARYFIGRYVADESIGVFHIYFPDPWPKKRHHKRRFFQPANIAAVHRILKRGGQLRTATDHDEYYEFMCEVMLEHPVISRQFRKVDFLPVESADEGEWVGSNFERKYIKEGRKFYTLAMEKV